MMKSYVNEALTASSFWGVDPKELGDVIAKYGPFDFLSVKNDSGYTISFMVDDDSKPATVSRFGRTVRDG